MQEELENQTVAIVFRAGRFTAQSLANAMHRALERGLNRPRNNHEPHGKMKLSELVGKGNETKKLEFKEEDLKSFHKTAVKYNIDYAVHKEPDGDKNKYYVFFQAKDATVLDSAFKEFIAKNEKHKESVQKKLEQKQEIVKKRKEKQQERNHKKERNRELR